MLLRVTDQVLIRQSSYCRTNSVVILGQGDAALLVDPGVTEPELADLAAELDRRGRRVVAGVATHPHWDHVLWHSAWPGVPRYATARCAQEVTIRRAQLCAEAVRDGDGVDTTLLGRLTPLPLGSRRVPWPGPPVFLVAHSAHAPGHLALLVLDDGVLVAGDMLSDVEVPLLDVHGSDPVSDYARGLRLLAALEPVRWVVPGHGGVGDREAFHHRLALDQAYLTALVEGEAGTDPRLAAGAPAWLVAEHQAQRRAARGEMS